MGQPALPKDERSQPASRDSRQLDVERILQPDDVTCGPTCLRKVYGFYGQETSLADIIGALERNEDGGTLAVFLGIAALKQGFQARIYSYDLRIFDPTWFGLPPKELTEKIFARFPYLSDERRLRAAGAYIRFLEMGGSLAFDELTPALLKAIIDRDHPILAGLSATYLYRFARERWDEKNGKHVDDDIRGEPTGHFVVISGYDQSGRTLTVVDPSEHVPVSANGRVRVDSDRLINAILLGDVTYDAALLEVWP
jgi:hypothetical protein